MIAALVFLLCSVLLIMASILIYAGILLLRRPLERLYWERADQEDFVAYDEIPPQMIRFIRLVEDEEFFEHRGYSLWKIRCAIQTNQSAGIIVTGGSTITQQLIKNLYFNFYHRYLRKAAELLLSLVAERRFGKQRILEFYLNIIYFGNGIYGITDAARFYFDKELSALSVNQMFLLACVPSAPTKGNPVQHPEVFTGIRDKRLAYLRQKGFLTEDELRQIVPEGATLDAELRKNDAHTSDYPQDVVMINERFGPRPSLKRGR